jgi:Uma2 family endonuclease
MALTDRSSTSLPADLPDDSGPSRWVGARMSLEEFLALPEEKPYLEYDDGVVKQKMAPQGDHGGIQIDFGGLLNQLGRARRHGRAFTETRFVTPDWAPVPDISYYRIGRIQPESPDSYGDFQVPPDIAVEIVSPAQSVSEQLKKCLRYAELGVTISLVIDPSDRTIYAIRPDQPLRVLQGNDRIDVDDVLPGFELTVQDLFALSAPAALIDDAAHPSTDPGESESTDTSSP